jgi:DNA-binding MltR family transcriptional regulator
MLEQRYVIKFLLKEQNGLKEIHCRLKAVYGNGAMKQTQVCW